VTAALKQPTAVAAATPSAAASLGTECVLCMRTSPRMAPDSTSRSARGFTLGGLRYTVDGQVQRTDGSVMAACT